MNSQEVDDFVSKRRDMLVVISAGNDGQAAQRQHAQVGSVDWLSIGAPASCKNAITVSAASRRGNYGVLFGASCPDELCRLHRPAPKLYRAVIRTAEELAGNRTLLSVKWLMSGEVRARRPLRDRELSYNATQRRRYCASLRNRRFLASAPNRVAARTRSFKEADEERRALTRLQLGAKTASGIRRWWQQHEANIDDWVMTHLESARLAELPAERDAWPEPRNLPALRSYFAYKLARIALTVGDGRRIAGSDYFDAEHFACSAYADFLATEDGQFRETRSIASGPRSFRLMRLNDS